MPDHIKASIERLFHKIPAMKFPPISMSGFQSIYHFTVNAHCTHFLPGAPLTANFSVERECPPSSVISRNLIPKPTPPQIRPSEKQKAPDHAVNQQFNCP